MHTHKAQLAAVSLALLIAPPALSQEQPETEPERQRPTQPVPDLDELLGLPADDKGRDAQRADLERADLDRRLSAQEISQAFEEAVVQMRDVADALRSVRDTGMQTQRTQEDIVRKLDILIQQAEQNQSQSQSQSSAQQRPRPQDQQPTPGQQQQAQSQQQEAPGDNTQEGMPPGGREARLGELLDAAQAAWGALPPRVRDVLLQGSGDRFSSLYESMTESYYRRLAEEGRRE